MSAPTPSETSLQWLGEFLSQLAHDLSSPARNSAGFCELVQRQTEALGNETLHKHATLACSETQRMQAMLHATMQLGQLYTQPVTHRALDVAALAQFIWESTIASEYQEATLSIDAAESITMDPALATLLLEALFRNGCQYNTNTPEITLRTRKDTDGSVCLEVQDNGVGLAPEDFENGCRLFQRLAGKQYAQGIGAGLTYAQTVASRHNATLTCDKAPSGGTCITLHLPDSISS